MQILTGENLDSGVDDMHLSKLDDAHSPRYAASPALCAAERAPPQPHGVQHTEKDDVKNGMAQKYGM